MINITILNYFIILIIITYYCIDMHVSLSTFAKVVSPSMDGIHVRLAARTAVVIQVGAEPVANAIDELPPVQRIARHPTNCYRQLEVGEGNQPVGRALVHRIARHPTLSSKIKFNRKRRRSFTLAAQLMGLTLSFSLRTRSE